MIRIKSQLLTTKDNLVKDEIIRFNLFYQLLQFGFYILPQNHVAIVGNSD